MLRPSFVLATLVALAAPFAFAACGDGNGNGTTGTNTFPTGSGGGGGKGSSSGSGTGGAGGVGNLFDAGTGTGGNVGTGGNSAASYLIYASTDTDLFTLDPNNVAAGLTHVGPFDCISTDGGAPYAMVDVAVNKDGDLWGITGHDAYPLAIQGGSVHCGTKVQLNNYSAATFYALTFAPVGAIDPSKEVLVGGNAAGELWAYDDVTKTAVQHGNFGTVPAADPQGNAYPSDPSTSGTTSTVGKLWELSGDIVFLYNNGNPVGFATVRDCPNPPSTTGCSKIDTLIEIDMTKLGQPGTQNVTKAIRGQILRAPSCTSDNSKGYGSMYGIAAWEGQVYGFSRTGNLVSISNNDGSACFVQSYSPNKFSGAAVTTLAPVIPPPPPPG
jgi:hypothetical protein